MTIKQQGGIFGRNPTYNDVEANNLDVNASLSVSGQSSLTGDVAVGLSSPSAAMHVYNTSALDHIKIDGPVVNRSLNFSTSNSNRWNIYASGAAETGSNAGSDLAIARYTDAGGYLGAALGITRSNANITTYGNIIMANGKGIDFSATSGTGTSELFDDYEEGVATITLTPNTSGSITLESALDSLSYTKVGRLVTLTGYLEVASVSSPVGTYVTLAGLPFTSASAGGSLEYGNRSVAIMASNDTTSRYSGFLGDASTSMNFFFDASTVSASSAFYLNFSYITA